MRSVATTLLLRIRQGAIRETAAFRNTLARSKATSWPTSKIPWPSIREHHCAKLFERECSRHKRSLFFDVCFSNRPLGVKHFQTIHVCGVGVAHGLVLLFGIGTKALPVWDSKTRRNNLWGGLAVLQTVGPSGHTNSPHPSSREGHHSTARWNSSVLLSRLILLVLTPL